MFLRFRRSPLRISALLCCLLCGILISVLGGVSIASSTPPKKHLTTKSTSHGKHRSHKTRVKGQQKIDSQRAHDIQEALIRNHYMTGQPTGTWDATSQKAMEKFQSDNGWQSKIIPDSRALIKLGLGPDHQHLLNPESAMTSPDKIRAPAEAKTQSDPPAALPTTTAPIPAETSSSQN